MSAHQDAAARVRALGTTVVGLDTTDATAHAERLGLHVRVLHPGTVHTMEYVEGRANLVVDDTGVVVRVYPG